jgi:putative phosphoserine phosphatase / 1-acylglycerol-3-phosphate O-acyltransferase
VSRGQEAKDGEEVKEVKEKSGRVSAFFDLDGTLVALPSLEGRFFRMLRYRREIRAKNYFLWLAEAVRVAPRGVSAILQANKMYLRGIAADRWRAGGLKPAPTFYEDGLERVAWHARQGHTIVMVSGTLEPLAQETARAIEAELAARGMAVRVRVRATRLEEEEGRWTGRIVGEAMFGHAKARAAKRLAEEMQLDLANCYSYGDSVNDRWMLEAVGHAAAVNPSKKLARIAREQEWPALRWKERNNVMQRTQRTQSLRRGVESTANSNAGALRELKSGEVEKEHSLCGTEIREAGMRSLG